MRLVATSVAALTVVTLLTGAAVAGNQEVADGVAEALHRAQQANEFQSIRIKVQDGIAWLKGPVPSKDHITRAMTLAQQVPGIERVRNEMTVQVASQRPQSAQPAAGRTRQVMHVQQQGPVDGPSLSATTPVVGFPSAGQYPPGTAHPAGNLAQGSFAPISTTPPVAPAHGMTPPLAQGQAMPAVPGTGMAPGGYPAGGAYPGMTGGAPIPVSGTPPMGAYPSPLRYDQPYLPSYAWPSYAAYPNYAAVTYPRQHSAMAWPYIGPFYPYPQVPLGWRKVTLEWDDGWWMLSFGNGYDDYPHH